ncbi:MAG TPA: nucleotide exchange factor GrpE [Verrucomicrobiota bacterium]|nr:nucleotide exchange factor GrpE [Verrucomicrobiota bacterium]
MKKSEPHTQDHSPASPQTPEAVLPIDPATVNPAQLEELKTLAAKADEHWERLLRTTADFDNFKKRAARERQDAIRYANESLIQKLLPVLDNFEMALSATQAGDQNSLQSLRDGIVMVQQQLKSALVEAGMEEIDATGKPFDPNLHEAVSQLESAEVADGNVLQQLRKGYKLRDRLLRPATVVVAKKPSA